MWPKFIQSKWFERLFTASISIIGITITLGVSGMRDSKASLRKELNTKATIEYVDKQDASTMKALETHSRETEKQSDALMEMIKSMDHKIDILITDKKR